MPPADPDPAVAHVLRLVLDDLAHPRLHTNYSWAVDLAGYPVPATDPRAVRWSLQGMARRHALPDEALVERVRKAITAHFPDRANYQQHATEEDRMRVVREALAQVEGINS